MGKRFTLLFWCLKFTVYSRKTEAHCLRFHHQKDGLHHCFQHVDARVKVCGQSVLCIRLTRRTVRRDQPVIHQLITVAARTAAAVLVKRIRQEAREPHTLEAIVHTVQRAVPADDRRLFVPAHAHPHRYISLEGTLQTVECAELEDLTVLLHKDDLLLDLGDFLLRKFVEVELIAKRPEVRRICARMQRSHAVDLMVRHDGDMAAHTTHGIAHRRAVLDLLPLGGI